MAATMLSPNGSNFGMPPPGPGKDPNRPPPSPQDKINPFQMDTEDSSSASSLETEIDTRRLDDTTTHSDISVSKQTVIEMGYPEPVVQLAIDIFRLDHKGADFAHATDLFTAVEDMCFNPQKQADAAVRLHEAKQAKQRASTPHSKATKTGVEHKKMEDVEPKDLLEIVHQLAKDNHRLKQRKMCRACRKVDLASSGVTFLPCGHFIVCEACSEMFDDCPACGKSIMGTVRTYMS